MDDIALLERVLDRTVARVGSIRDDHWGRPTPCPDYDVRGLVGHVTGWAPVFAAAAQGEHFEGDPSSYEVGPATVDDLRTEAERIVAGWREKGQERQVTPRHRHRPATALCRRRRRGDPRPRPNDAARRVPRRGPALW